MGTHGKGAVGHAFLGSVAEKYYSASPGPFTSSVAQGKTDVTLSEILIFGPGRLSRLRKLIRP